MLPERKKDYQFKLKSSFEPKGGQPAAIECLVRNIENNVKHQTLLGITGSGKTFTVANLVERINRPALIIAHNKTLAAQLFMEFRELFPSNAVEYFVSYYDYYQPEAYVPSSDTYIEKDSSINETIDKMRHSATRSLLERNDVIIVSSVSCIYGLGSPEAYYGLLLHIYEGQEISREQIIQKLIDIRYNRRDDDFSRVNFRVRGDTIEVFPAAEEKRAIRIELFGDYIDALSEIDALTGRRLRKLSKASVYPTSHFITAEKNLNRALGAIREELEDCVRDLKNRRMVLEAKRLEQRTKFDLEMLEHVGFCNGIENYSRHLTGRKPGDPPYTLLDYFPKNFVLFIDESHVTVPQIRGMYYGDRSRKNTLVNHGFRLPSALDNRPLTFEEFNERIGQTVFVSATPAKYELEKSKKHLIEQIIRPTGLLDPLIEVKPAKNQIDHLIPSLREQVKKTEKTLITTLTKKSAEHLSEYLQSLDFKTRYMHADTETMERSQLIKDLRLGLYDILIGINLLREGLDIPEVSLVAILDADKEGYLRSETSLLQICGRAARHEDGRVLMFADKKTKSMRACIDETNRRRKIQQEFNEKNNIKPGSIRRDIQKSLHEIAKEQGYIGEEEEYVDLGSLGTDVETLEKEKVKAVKELDFEKAAKIRDRISQLKNQVVFDIKAQ